MVQPEAHKIPVGISACLAGQKVRYNGGHKHSKLCTQELGKHFDFIATCPEMSIGLGVPRKPIRLVDIQGSTRVRDTETNSLDFTNALYSQGEQFLKTATDICGFIFTQNSPSCGLHGVKVYHQNGNPLTKDQGAFAKAILKKAPYLPVEEAGRLNDALLRHTFITAVYTYHDWQTTVAPKAHKKALIDFHSRHKLLLMAHSTQAYKTLGKLISNLSNVDLNAIKQQYLNTFMAAIKTPTSRGRHCNAMQHIQGYLKKSLKPAEKRSITQTIHEYRKGYIPLVVPITLLNHYTQLTHNDNAYINQQSYLRTYPKELGLRNEI